MARWFIRNDPVVLLERQIQHLQQHNEHLRKQNDSLIRLLERAPVAVPVPDHLDLTVVDGAADEVDLSDDEVPYIPSIRVESVKITTTNRTESFDERAVESLRKKGTP